MARIVKPRVSVKNGMLVTETPFDKNWIDALKFVIPAHERVWDSRNYLWLLHPQWYTFVLQTFQDFFGKNYLDSVAPAWPGVQAEFREKYDRWRAGERKVYTTTQASRVDPYAVLGLTKNAEIEVIKAAHRALVKKYHQAGTHPDELRMVAINEAYEAINV